MPPVVAAVGAALVEIGVGATTASIIASVTVGLAESFAIGAAANLILGTPNHGSPGLVAQPIKLRLGQDAQESRAWAYGRVSVGGTIKYWEANGTDNKNLWFVAAYHDTPIDAVEKFYVNNNTGLTEISFTANAATTSPYSGFMYRYDKLGVVDQSVESNLDAASSTWGTNHRLRGVAYYVWKLIYDPNVYPNGYPEPMIVFRARKLWDPRATTATITTATTDTFTTSGTHGLVAGDQAFIQNCTATYVDQLGQTRIIERDWTVHSSPSPTTFKIVASDGSAMTFAANGTGGTVSKMAWSQNAALCALDYVIGVRLQGVFIGGMKCPLAGLDQDSWIAAANVCDEDVALNGGGTEKRYTINGYVMALEDKQGVFAAMLQAMAAVPSVRNGKLGIIPGAALAITTTLTDDDLAGPITVNPSRSFQDKHNTVTSICYDRLSNQGTADVPILTDSTFLAADGGITLEREVRHRFVDSDHLATAQRINKILLSNEREQLTITAMFKPKAAKIPLYGTFNWTSDAAGYFAQKMRLLSRKRNPDGSFEIVARQETDAKYSWSESTEELPAPSFATHTSFDPMVIAAPGSGDIHVSATTIAGAGGALVSTFLLTADTPPSPFVKEIRTQYKLHADSVWQDGPSIVNKGAGGTAYIQAIAPGVAYDFGFAYRTSFGTSSYTTITNVTANSWNVTSGMIGTSEVATANIAANAATLPITSSNSSEVAVSGSTWTLLTSITATFNGSPTLLTGSIIVRNADSGNHLYGVAITYDSTDPTTGTPPYKSSTTQNFPCQGSADDPFSVQIQPTPSSGSHTYRMYLRSDTGNIKSELATLSAVESRR